VSPHIETATHQERVEAAAQPGEVMVSSTVKDLVVGSGLGFESRGERQLKGVPGPGTCTS
jgi:class 3 adenylate cyclase